MSRSCRARLDAPVLLLVLLALVVSIGWPGPAPAAAQEDTGSGEPSAQVSVSHISGVLGPGSVPPQDDPLPEGAPPPPPAPEDLELRLLVTNDGESELTNLRLVTEVFAPIDSRSLLRQTLDAEIVNQRLLEVENADVRDGEALEPGGIAGLEVTVTGRSIGWSGKGGVYPVQVTVFRGSEQLDRLVTAVVYLADAPVGDLETVVVWPLDDEPWRGAHGVYPSDVDAPIRPGGRLDRILDAAERASAGRIVLAPAPHLLEDLADRADGFLTSVRTDEGSEVREVAAEEPEAQRSAAFLERVVALTNRLATDPVVGPYADADVASLAQSPEPLPAAAGTAISEGRRRLQAATGRAPDRSTYLSTTPLDETSLGLVPAEHVILPWNRIVGPDLDNNPDLPYALRTLSTGTRRFTAAVADPRIEDLLVAPPVEHGSAVAVQRLVAETAMVYFTAPGKDGRPLVVMPPPDWNPHPRFPAPALRSLISAPWIHLVGPTEQLDAATDAFPTARLEETDATLPGGIREEMLLASRDLNALRAALLPQVERIEGRTPAELADQLLRAPSMWFTGGDVGQAATLVRDVQGVVDAGFGEVDVPSSVGIILTSDSGNIPVTLQRPRGVPLRVQVEVESQGRLTWPGEGRFREVPLPTGSKTVSFSTRALSRGRFPVTVTVTDPSGTRVLERVTLSVSSTAISRPALYVTGGVVVALLLWGAVRRRRPKRPKLEVVE